MLSPHEFATLLLARDVQDRRELDPVDLEALLERGLVTLEECAPGQACPHITSHGYALLRAVGWQGETARPLCGGPHDQEASAR
ncbi:hypothetical protein P3W85_36370 [Cupriavidus basilensis]|uniref:Preprotein translocase subunit SecA n=1 Tax=Cupriavidus basilensis TaxID=68895 RepID=A0ABT6B0G5_9BURK|nr:hypothetical protein [Cupriavidus basilensis]MDF3838367.1 hypothetical protein [Cupriavidus basilensis]